MNEHWLRRLEQAATDEEKIALITLMTLENQPEAARRAALAAAVPHWFDAAVLAALLTPPVWARCLKWLKKLFLPNRAQKGKEEASPEPPPLSEGRGRGGVAEIYATLQTLPFAQRYGESGHALHELTRAGLIGYLLRERPDDFRAYSRRAARFFAAKDAIECVYHRLATEDAAGRGAFEDLIIELCKQRRDLSGAHRLVAYLRELLALRALTGAKAERALSFGYSYLGDLQMNYASVSAAAETYQKALEFDRRLAQEDPANAAAQRDLSVSYERIGGARMTLGDTAAAVAAYQQSLAIAERLAQADPANAAAQRDLSISYNKIGDTAAAVAAYQQSLAIRERLAQADPANATAQRDLCASFYRLGAVQEALEQPEAARQWYQQALPIAARLAAQDPANAQAQSDLKELQETIEKLQGGQS